MRKIRKLLRSISANTVVTFAMATPALMAVAGVAIDYVNISKKHSNLQAIADAAAIAAAHELPLANADKAVIKAAAQEYIKRNLKNSSRGSTFKTTVKVVDDFSGVTVQLSEVWKPFFAHFLTDKATPIVATAKANILGEGMVCVVGMMPLRQRAGIHMDDNAKLDAPDCGVYSNSPGRVSIRLDKNSSINARQVCSTGGYRAFGRGTSIEPKPVTDCPPINDPLAKRSPPKVGNCDYNGLVLEKPVITPAVSRSDVELAPRFERLLARFSREKTFNIVKRARIRRAKRKRVKIRLNPGVYCGGLIIGDKVDARLSPGVYVIKDGPLLVTGRSVLRGNNVGFYLTGENSIFDFQPNTTISISAPKKGPMAGLLIAEDKNLKVGTYFNPFDLGNLPDDIRLNRIRSNHARKLLGTIYLPKSILMVDANGPVAEDSAYTAIIAWRVWLRDGPTLRLNADYKSSDVPLPTNLVGGQVVLAE